MPTSILNCQPRQVFIVFDPTGNYVLNATGSSRANAIQALMDIMSIKNGSSTLWESMEKEGYQCIHVRIELEPIN